MYFEKQEKILLYRENTFQHDKIRVVTNDVISPKACSLTFIIDTIDQVIFLLNVAMTKFPPFLDGLRTFCAPNV